MSELAAEVLVAELEAVSDYALRPLPLAFGNLDILAPLLPDHGAAEPFDVTAFYSRRRTDLTAASEADLAAYNQCAFDAARAAGGLVLYYQGSLLPPGFAARKPEFNLGFTPNCLSFCIWQSLAQAKGGSAVEAHRLAAARAGDWYERFAIRKFRASSLGGKVLLREAVAA